MESNAEPGPLEPESRKKISAKISERFYRLAFRLLAFCGIVALFVLAYVAILAALTEPRNDRVWREELAILPEADISDERVRVRNVRNFWWHAPIEMDMEINTEMDTDMNSEMDTAGKGYEPAYYDADYELSELHEMYLAVAPFSDYSGAAHTFLTFQFDVPESPESIEESLGPRFLSVSVEARKEEGEEYSPLGGLFNRYELMYVLADERDMITLRTHAYGSDVFLYPVDLPADAVRETFLSIMEEVNALNAEPAFYHTFAKNCTTELVRHFNRAQGEEGGMIPFSLRYVLPGYADSLMYDLGLIDTDLFFTAAEEHFNVTERSRECALSGDFSLCIRNQSPEAGIFENVE